MKNNVKNTSCETCYICSRKHKVLAWFALVGIFLCGMLTGVSLWGYKHARTANPAAEKTLFKRPCQVKEEALMNKMPRGGWSDESEKHLAAVSVYKKLAENGCSENKDYFEKMVIAETEIARAIKDIDRNEDANNGNDFVEYNEAGVEPCEVIERTLQRRIDYGCDMAECHSYNAEIYAKMAEDGCVKNKELNTQKALNELQIADGVRVNDRELSENDVRTTVNTYKKLQMQNEARRYIKKAEKLINPGVDFIMELQRVIEE
ncbi:MAG: hypothetical protein J5613_04235 [Alphaproteobacteria bacterium]|nr:hypothetical protein [Alphaproteobacteria bacterium]